MHFFWFKYISSTAIVRKFNTELKAKPCWNAYNELFKSFFFLSLLFVVRFLVMLHISNNASYFQYDTNYHALQRCTCCLFVMPVTSHQVIVFLLRNLCSYRRRKTTTFYCGCRTPTRVGAVTTALHSLYEFDRHLQPSRRRWHCLKLQDQLLPFCGQFGTACIFRARSATSTWSFAPVCDHQWMEISTRHSEVLCLFTNPRQCALQESRNTVQQVEKFEYLGVVFTSDGWRSKSLMQELAKQTQVCVRFIVQWSQNGSFQITQNWPFLMGRCSDPQLCPWKSGNVRQNTIPSEKVQRRYFCEEFTA